MYSLSLSLSLSLSVLSLCSLVLALLECEAYWWAHLLLSDEEGVSPEGPPPPRKEHVLPAEEFFVHPYSYERCLASRVPNPILALQPLPGGMLACHLFVGGVCLCFRPCPMCVAYVACVACI
jgi:hypothetical protein